MDYATLRDLFRIGRDRILSGNTRISRDAVERKGTDTNIIVNSAAAVGDAVIGQVAAAEAGTFLDSARGVKLDRLVFDRYGIKRKASAPAIGEVTFATTALAPASFVILSGTVLSTRDGRQFVTTSTETFLVNTTALVVPVRSVLAGSTQQAAKNTIVTIVSDIFGAPSDLTVNNPTATAGVADDEEDDDLIVRARNFFPNARKGTLAAIQNGALAVPGVKNATAFEVLDPYGRPAKGVTLVVTDAFTQALIDTTPTPVAYQAQSQAFADTVFNALSDTRAGGIFVGVTVAVVQMMGVRLALSFKPGVNADQVALAARAAIVSYVNGLAPGAPFVYTDAIAALQNVYGLYVYGNEIASPAGNVIPANLQVLRTDLASVTVSSSASDQQVQVSA